MTVVGYIARVGIAGSSSLCFISPRSQQSVCSDFSTSSPMLTHEPVKLGWQRSSLVWSVPHGTFASVSLVANDVEVLFPCSPATCVSLEKSLFRSFAHLKTAFFGLLLLDVGVWDSRVSFSILDVILLYSGIRCSDDGLSVPYSPLPPDKSPLSWLSLTLGLSILTVVGLIVTLLNTNLALEICRFFFHQIWKLFSHHFVGIDVCFPAYFFLFPSSGNSFCVFWFI